MNTFLIRINLLLLLPVLRDHPSWMRWYIIVSWFILAEGGEEAFSSSSASASHTPSSLSSTTVTAAPTSSYLTNDARLCPHFLQNQYRNATRRLIINPCGIKVLPRQFRNSTQPLDYYLSKYERRFGPVTSLPRMDGYESTRMFGSSQFRPSQLQRLANYWRQHPVLVVDLRMESHGFLDDVAVSYFCPKNWDLLMVTDVEELQMVEWQDFSRLHGQSKTLIYDKDRDDVTTSKMVHFQTPWTERQVVESLGLEYRRIHVPDHRRPRDTEVEQLVELFRNYPTVEIYFHCKAGKGRTTTAMIMRDIHLNAHHIPLTDIMERNCIYSRYNVVLQIEKNRGTYREVEARRRLCFFRLFYDYTREQYGLTDPMSWSEWIKAKEGNKSLAVLMRYAKVLVDYLVNKVIGHFHIFQKRSELLLF